MVFRAVGVLPPIWPKPIVHDFPSSTPTIVRSLDNYSTDFIVEEIVSDFHPIKFIDNDLTLSHLRGGKFISNAQLLETLVIIILLQNNFTREQVEAFIQHYWGEFKPTLAYSIFV